MFGKISIQMKLTLILMISLAPIALLLYLFIEEKRASIEFSSLESEGVSLMKVLTPVIQSAADTHGAHFKPNAGEPSPYLEKLSQNFSIFEKAIARSSISGLEKISKQTKDVITTLSLSPTLENTLQSLKDLDSTLEAVGDKSNLVLDPDLDSFYVMDTVIFQTYPLIQALGKIMYLQTQTTESAQKEKILSLGGIHKSLSSIRDGIQTAIENNKSGYIETQLQKDTQTFLLFMNNILNKMELNEPLNYEIYAQIVKNITEYWGKTQNTLDYLLVERIKNIRHSFFMNLGIVAALLIAAIAISCMISRYISKNIISLL